MKVAAVPMRCCQSELLPDSAIAPRCQRPYRGTLFRSTLEADWAATLDQLGITWQYEPEAVKLPSGPLYRPDFYLPRIATWLEVKGPHDDRIWKTEELAGAVCHQPECADDCHGEPGCYWSPYQVVVIGRAPAYGLADWTLLDPDRAGFDPHGWPWDPQALHQCPRCRQWWWPTSGAYGCRACRRDGGGDGDLHLRSYWPGSRPLPASGPACLGLPFGRAR